MKNNKKLKIEISARFWSIFNSELKLKRSRAEPKILQLELWLEPARLRLITMTYPLPYRTTLSDSLIEQPYSTAILNSLIGQPYFKEEISLVDPCLVLNHVLYLNTL